MKKGGRSNTPVKRIPIQRDTEIPKRPGEKPQYRPGFGPQNRNKPGYKSKQSFWVFIIIIILIIIGIIFVRDLITFITNDFGVNFGGSANYGVSCQTICNGYSITVAPNCNCPPGSTYYNTITNPPELSGYKQCIC